MNVNNSGDEKIAGNICIDLCIHTSRILFDLPSFGSESQKSYTLKRNVFVGVSREGVLVAVFWLFIVLPVKG